MICQNCLQNQKWVHCKDMILLNHWSYKNFKSFKKKMQIEDLQLCSIQNQHEIWSETVLCIFHHSLNIKKSSLMTEMKVVSY